VQPSILSLNPKLITVSGQIRTHKNISKFLFQSSGKGIFLKEIYDTKYIRSRFSAIKPSSAIMKT
jgi:hypothetical protein